MLNHFDGEPCQNFDRASDEEIQKELRRTTEFLAQLETTDHPDFKRCSDRVRYLTVIKNNRMLAPYVPEPIPQGLTDRQRLTLAQTMGRIRGAVNMPNLAMDELNDPEFVKRLRRMGYLYLDTDLATLRLAQQKLMTVEPYPIELLNLISDLELIRMLVPQPTVEDTLTEDLQELTRQFERAKAAVEQARERLTLHKENLARRIQ